MVLRWAIVAVAALVACSDDGPPAPAEAVSVRASGCAAVDDVASGVVVAPGHVLTVAHVLRDATTVTIDGVPGVVVALDARLDAAVVAAATDGPPVTLASDVGAGPARIGRQVVTVRRVVVAEVEEPRDATTYTRRALVLDADVGHGDSGAAVLADDGALLGMVFASSTRTEDVAYAVTADELAPLVSAALAAPAAIVLRCA